jgi:AcrR family transcriptional regulator
VTRAADSRVVAPEPVISPALAHPIEPGARLGPVAKPADEEVPAPRTRRPGGRSERVLRQVVAATTAILAEQGVPGVTVEAVAQRAGVNPSTIYRRWRSPQLLMLAAFQEELSVSVNPPEDTGTFRGDLKAFLMRVSDYVQTEQGSALVQAIFVRPQVHGETFRQYFEHRFTILGEVVGRAQRRGELPEDLEARKIIEVPVAAILFRVVVQQESVSPHYIDWLTDFTLKGVQAIEQPGEWSPTARTARAH